jgi:hypothetical protein
MTGSAPTSQTTSSNPDDVLGGDLPHELVVVAVIKKCDSILENTENDPNS